jgi:serine/threonine-protein kinase
VDTVICPHCHAPLFANARFCPACGKATSSTEPDPGSWPQAGAPDLVGREIAGRYRIVKKLGEGGMGAVYRGEQISLKRAVAVKLLKPELGANQMVLRRFNAEAEAVAKLSHPNTVNIYDFGQDSDGSLFIAMEFIEGRSLRDAIQKEGPFSPTRAISIAIQVAASLSDAHAHSIVHRDLKPDNVMLQDRGRQRDVVRVLDFGIAKLRDDNRATQQAMTQAGDMLGTPQYMAPEQIRGEAIDGRTDIYALGCMIYEMVTARLPYEAPTIMAMLSKHLLEQVVRPSQRRPDLMIPPALDQLVLAAMAKDPAARPATMDRYAEMLQALLATLPADPNRSAGMSVQQPVVAPLAPASHRGPLAGPPTAAPPMTPPPGPASMPPMAPSVTPPPMGAPMTPAAMGPSMPPPPMTPAAMGSSMTPPPMGPPMTPPPTAPGPSTFPPPMTPPPGISPASFGAPSAAVQTANIQTTPTPVKSGSPIWIVLGILVLAGAGVGVWFAMRDGGTQQGPAKPARPDPWDDREQPARPDEPDDHDEPAEPGPKPAPNGDDPWS